MTEDAAREQLAACTRIFTMYGLLGMFGHISAYLPASERVVMCPGAGADKSTVRPEEMLVLDLAGRVLAGTGDVPREWPIHTALHRARPDALAVAHCHAHYSTLFAIAQRELRPVTLGGAIFPHGVPVYTAVEFIDTPDAGQRLLAAIGDQMAILLRCHGFVTVGGSVDAMLHTSLVLEDNARKAVEAVALGAVEPLTPEDCVRLLPTYPEQRARAHFAYLRTQEQRWDRQTATGLGPPV
jgi:ribulose-5-phosphate 4-epimerase/fuculose-1-phosphate aldolase